VLVVIGIIESIRLHIFFTLHLIIMIIPHGKLRFVPKARITIERARLGVGLSLLRLVHKSLL
jgi:hypothetical protein